MITVGYEQPDGTVAYIEINDNTLENVIPEYVHRDTQEEGDTKVASTAAYFSSSLSDEEDTRFRFLRTKDGVWMIREYYGGKQYLMTFAKVGGSKRRSTRRHRKN